MGKGRKDGRKIGEGMGKSLMVISKIGSNKRNSINDGIRIWSDGSREREVDVGRPAGIREIRVCDSE